MWSDPEGSARIRQALHDAGMARRPRYADLTEASFWLTKKDGRRYARHWDDDASKWRYVYRSRWRWEQAFGPVPEGYEVHHKDENTSNDELSNLQALPMLEHQRGHMTPERARERRSRHKVKGEGSAPPNP